MPLTNIGFIVPAEVRNQATDTDYILMIDTDGIPYKIAKADLLSGTAGTGGGNTGTDPQFSQVPLLLHGNGIDGSTIITNSGNSTHLVNIANNGVHNSSIKSVFGGLSLSFDGTNSLNCTSTSFNVGNQDCTIETFLNITSTILILDMRPDNVNGAYPTLYLDGGKLTLYFNSANAISTVSLIPGNWYYIAVKKIGNLTQLWVDGTKLGEFISGDWASSGRIKLGENSFYAPGTDLNGYMEEFRFTVGSARDVSIIPLSAFPNN